MQPTRVYFVLMLAFVAALLIGSVIFFIGMGGASYVVSDGVQFGTNFLDKPRYDSNLQGFVFSVSFLVASIFLMVMIVLPDDQAAARVGASAPPQPRRRGTAPPRPTSAPPTAPGGAPRPSETPVEVPVLEGDSNSSTVERVTDSGTQPEAEAAGMSESVAAEEPAPQADAEKTLEKDLPITDLPDAEFEVSGEEDIVYGSGRVTDDSMWEFIQSYPDSAVKFLYRKSLENKPLSPTDEDIYRRWEKRGMTRAKVRELVLTIMNWKSLPSDFPHNIWRELRDQIYELQTK